MLQGTLAPTSTREVRITNTQPPSAPIAPSPPSRCPAFRHRQPPGARSKSCSAQRKGWRWSQQWPQVTVTQKTLNTTVLAKSQQEHKTECCIRGHKPSRCSPKCSCRQEGRSSPQRPGAPSRPPPPWGRRRVPGPPSPRANPAARTRKAGHLPPRPRVPCGRGQDPGGGCHRGS